jgi:hypothetical protein
MERLGNELEFNSAPIYQNLGALNQFLRLRFWIAICALGVLFLAVLSYKRRLERRRSRR